MNEKGLEKLNIEVTNSLPITQTIDIKNEQGDVIVCHEIYPIGSGPFLSLFGEDGKDLEEKQYPMFGSAIGDPETSSVYNAPDVFSNSEDRFILCCFVEESFYYQYFKNMSRDAYLRYVHDFEFDNWNERKLQEVIEYLKSRDIGVNLELQGDTSTGVYHAVLLFRRKNND